MTRFIMLSFVTGYRKSISCNRFSRNVVSPYFFMRTIIMTRFERNFLINSLMFLETILSVDKKLDDAIHHFTQGQYENPRYQINSRITNADDWSKEDKLKFTSAIAEAIALVSEKYENPTSETTEQIQSARNILLDDYVPLLTANTDPENRLKSVRENSSQIRKELIAKLKDEVPYKSQFENPYVLFPFVAATVAVAATAASVLFGNKP
ncbi:TPA: Dot/Icm T4SS effector MavE [Legionella pneumophila]|uniref:Uncharacterized protein n=2 Tax=Legionella pneumophila TaxID=446 RepID=A0A2S6EX74_LEGPN|nr:Dot/Icm T4SS effector MavE [Legionella pneumophila]HAT8682770.1 Dot/Icm T4SS effector MavE [Legionella pneumophila subsp. pneumophila ATCC 43283]HAT8842927.1 Dot/Icm T4SS effector MavE [Legionella pneumophila subsp. pneumophila]MCK1856925.1 Dot/Icm T4SS effector MavE [Legionella pneumophila]MCO1453878.1 Dot/Icm T4SS effector MavE [Legionella pneumophila]